MQTENNTSKPEDSPQQEAGEGCSGATCSPSLLAEDDVRWVVNDMGELGVEIHGQFFFCYKGRSISYADDPTHDDGSPILVREVGKREFGETVWPLSWHKAGTSQERYTVETVYTPGLSFGEPDNPRYQWTPLPSLENNQGEAHPPAKKL